MIKNRLAKFCFLTASVCLAGLSISNPTIKAREESIEERLFKRVEFAVERGKLQSSKDDIRRVLKLNPRHPGATFYAGKFSFENQDFNTAVKFLTRVENHSTYGAEARKMLAEIRLNQFRRKFVENLENAIKGEAYTQALNLCDEILAEMPQNKEALFLGTYAATMNSNQEKAQTLLESFRKSDEKNEIKAELKAFVDAIFSASYSPETAIEKLLSLTDPRLLTEPVRRRLKDMIVALKQLELYERFINQEKKRAGADVNKLEREMIEFLIEQKQYDKAMELANERPADQIEDNMIILRLQIHTGQELKAMLTARQLMSVNPHDLRLYESWTEAWLGYVKRTSKIPEGKDATGKSYDEMTEEVLDRLKLDKLVSLQPALLLNLVRIAVLTGNESKVKETAGLAVKISFNSKNLGALMNTVDSLIEINRSSIASNLLESARNQLPDNPVLSIRLAEIYYSNNNPEVAAKILEGVLQEHPQIIRAFLLWADCMSVTGRGSEAEKMTLLRLAEPDLNDLVKRQLNNKLEMIRMQSSARYINSSENSDPGNQPDDLETPGAESGNVEKSDQDENPDSEEIEANIDPQF